MHGVHYFFSGLLILSATLPFIKSDLWVFRVFDYPRLQKFVLLLIAFIAWFFAFPQPSWYDYALLGIISAALLYLAVVIWPFTVAGKKMIEQGYLLKGEKPLSLLVANVFQDNRNYQAMLDLIDARQPDIVMLLEADKDWQKGVKAIKKTYEFSLEEPLTNTYGLLFYSKLPVKYHEINYLIDKEIPSIVVDVLYNEQKVRLYGLHPTPPVPHENTESTERDAEILIVGKMAKEYGKPCIVFGDLNDVAWSYTTNLFLKASGMLDPRRGRGMYSTFHADHWFLRWPLDHYFLSSHFRLVDMKIEESIGSDHFPISISVVLRSDDTSEELEISHKEKKEVHKKIRSGVKKGDA